jgi:PAS domain S-box-containing protein
VPIIARDYWTGWKVVVLSEVLAFITLTPTLLSWLSEGRVLMKKSRAFHLEGVLLIAGLVLVSSIVFTLPENSTSPALFYTLVPFLLWSALRFGWLGVTTSLIAVTSLSIWGAVDGRGPFSTLVPLTNPVPLQMFLIFAAIPFLVLAALAEEHRQAAQVVRESEERFRLVANTAPVMIWMAGTDRLCTYVNQPWLQFTGRPLDAQLGNGWVQGIHNEDLNRCLETYSQAFDQRQTFAMEYRTRRNDGEYRWILDIGVPRFNSDGGFAGYVGSCLDITDRKLAEDALATVGRRLIEAHEEERARIGRELHDHINQRLALLAVALGELQNNPSEEARRLQDLQKDVVELSEEVQALSHGLHPSKLEYLGVVRGIRSWCREFGERQKVEIDFKEDVSSTVPFELGVTLFRILQEGLNNAVKHSGMKRIEAELTEHPGELHLYIRDSGRGFDIETALESRGLGLTSMRERARLVNGTFSIDTRPRAGTTIHVRVPFKADADSQQAAG